MIGLVSIDPFRVPDLAPVELAFKVWDRKLEFKLSHRRTKREREQFYKDEAAFVIGLCSKAREIWRKQPNPEKSNSELVRILKGIFRKNPYETPSAKKRLREKTPDTQVPESI